MKKEIKIMIFVIVLTAIVAFLLVMVMQKSAFIGKVFANSDNGNASEDIKTCLRSKEIILYVEPNDLQVVAQMDLIAGYLDSVRMIDCTRFPDECSGVVIYPSWKIDDKIIVGSLSPGALTSFSKC